MYALGEIALLCRLAQPQVGVVMNVRPIHLERLGTIERIAQAKAELVQALDRDGVAILNGDDARVLSMAEQVRGRVLTFGLEAHNLLRAENVAVHGLDGITFEAVLTAETAFPGMARRFPLRVGLLGAHIVHTALAAVAVGLEEGLTWDEIQRGLASLGPGLRLTPRRGVGGVTILDDCYNASPASMLAALNLLDTLPGRHLAVLGDMLELGALEVEGHQQVGRRAAHVLDQLVTVGERGKIIAAAARAEGLPEQAVFVADDNQAALALLRPQLRAGDTVLVKGSRSMGMETIVQALREPEA